LFGLVDTYAGKLAAERAAKRARGVRVVANDLQVRLRMPRGDVDIAADAARALALRATLPHTVQAVVHAGHVHLSGVVPTLFQRTVAENAVRHVTGVVGIVNNIHVAPVADSRDIKRDIVRALHREAEVNARAVQVSVSDHTVVLTGMVESWHERDAAEEAAMHAPGVSRVENRIIVAPDDDDDDDRAEYGVC
jgi:osmotically-inducible protein OsmY